MSRQYNFSSQSAPPEPRLSGSVLAIDTGSPVVSVALSDAGQIVAEQATDLRQSSGRILPMIDEVLQTAGLRLPEVDLLVALRGPGSFTGLRVGLSTLQGMRMALGIPTATLPTLQILATLAPPEAPGVTACVDALQGRWLTQVFGPPPTFMAVTEPEVHSAAELLKLTDRILVGFGISAVRARLQPASSLGLVEPGPLAPQALRVLHLCPPDRDPELLSSPLYLRAPSATPASSGRD